VIAYISSLRLSGHGVSPSSALSCDMPSVSTARLHAGSSYDVALDGRHGHREYGWTRFLVSGIFEHGVPGRGAVTALRACACLFLRTTCLFHVNLTSRISTYPHAFCSHLERLGAFPNIYHLPRSLDDTLSSALYMNICLFVYETCYTHLFRLFPRCAPYAAPRGCRGRRPCAIALYSSVKLSPVCMYIP